MLEIIAKIIVSYQTQGYKVVKEAVIIQNCLLSFMDNRAESTSKPNKRGMWVKKITSDSQIK